MVGIWELILIFAIVLFIFGARRIPDIAKSIGRGIKEFRKALEGREDKPEDGEDEKER